MEWDEGGREVPSGPNVRSADGTRRVDFEPLINARLVEVVQMRRAGQHSNQFAVHILTGANAALRVSFGEAAFHERFGGQRRQHIVRRAAALAKLQVTPKTF